MRQSWSAKSQRSASVSQRNTRASELCRRGIYAQLTLGNRKRTDLLVDSDSGVMLRIQVKAKQGRKWPGMRGIHGDGIVLVLVDYQKKAVSDQPDFYILRPEDWAVLIKELLVKPGHVKTGKVQISKEKVPTWRDGFVGTSVRSKDVEMYRDSWENLVKLTTSSAPKLTRRR